MSWARRLWVLSIVVRLHGEWPGAMPFHIIAIVLAKRFTATRLPQQRAKDVLCFKLIRDGTARRKLKSSLLEASECVCNIRVARFELQQRARLHEKRAVIADV